MQYFNKNENIIKLTNIVNEYYKDVFFYNKKFFDNTYKSRKFGEVIYNLKLFKYLNFIKKDDFVKIFDTFFNSFENAGTYETYIILFKTLFGENTIINFTNPNPAHLIINLSIYNNNFFNIITEDNDILLTEENDELMGSELYNGMNDKDIKNLLYFTTPNGIFLELIFNIIN